MHVESQHAATMHGWLVVSARGLRDVVLSCADDPVHECVPAE